MTINRLHTLLGAMIAAGHGRRTVCIDKPSFTHNLESDGCVILEVEDAALQTYNRIDDDGGLAVKADGSERTLTSLVLDGGGDSSLNRPAEPT